MAGSFYIAIAVVLFPMIAVIAIALIKKHDDMFD